MIRWGSKFKVFLCLSCTSLLFMVFLLFVIRTEQSSKDRVCRGLQKLLCMKNFIVNQKIKRHVYA